MTIGKKISLACSALVALTTILGTVMALNINHMNAELNSIIEGPLPGIYSLGLIQGYVKEQKLAMMEHIAQDTTDKMGRLESTITDLESKFQAEMKPFRKTIQTAQGRELFDKLGPLQERFNAIWVKILPLSRALKSKEALAIWNTEGLVA